jgi:hypothetical protein
MQPRACTYGVSRPVEESRLTEEAHLTESTTDQANAEFALRGDVADD